MAYSLIWIVTIIKENIKKNFAVTAYFDNTNKVGNSNTESTRNKIITKRKGMLWMNM